MGLIAMESTGAASSENTRRVLYPVFHLLFGLDPIHFVIWHHLLRKSGHVIGYAVLSLLLFRAWRASLPVAGSDRWSVVWARIALLMTALVASLDEWHQMFLPARTGTLSDVVLDSTAALAAQILLFLWLRGSRRPALVPTAEPPDVPIEKSEEATHTVSSPVAD